MSNKKQKASSNPSLPISKAQGMSKNKGLVDNLKMTLARVF